MNRRRTFAPFGALALFAATLVPALLPAQGIPNSPANPEVYNEPYRVAAAVVAASLPAPKQIVDIGAHDGMFLSAFLARFPQARGQFTESLAEEIDDEVKARMAAFGPRATIVVGCRNRGIEAACLPRETDVIVSAWVSIHQDLNGMYKIYANAAHQLPTGGYLAVLDHVGYGGSSWEPQMKQAAQGMQRGPSGPAIHHSEIRLPTLDEQIGAMRAAGFDVQVAWQSFNSVLFMARKR